MKKYLFGALVVLAAAAAYFVFYKTEVSQVSLMEEAVASIEVYQKDGDAEKAIQTLGELATRLSELKKAGGGEIMEQDAESVEKADRIRGELANASMELEISDKAEDQKVSKSLDDFMSR